MPLGPDACCRRLRTRGAAGGTRRDRPAGGTRRLRAARRGSGARRGGRRRGRRLPPQRCSAARAGSVDQAQSHRRHRCPRELAALAQDPDAPGGARARGLRRPPSGHRPDADTAGLRPNTAAGRGRGDSRLRGAQGLGHDGQPPDDGPDGRRPRLREAASGSGPRRRVIWVRTRERVPAPARHPRSQVPIPGLDRGRRLRGLPRRGMAGHRTRRLRVPCRPPLVPERPAARERPGRAPAPAAPLQLGGREAGSRTSAGEVAAVLAIGPSMGKPDRDW